MRTDSSGEITLVYEADTERFHRYRGHKSGKEVTVHLERFLITGRTLPHFVAPPTTIQAIITIEDKPKTVAEVNEERRIEKNARFGEAYGATKNFFAQEKSLYDRVVAAQQTQLLIEIRDALKRTKNNPRRSAKKRS
jgi:hypothetical protein